MGVRRGQGRRVDESNIPYFSFFLVSNASGSPLNLRATFVREDGTGIVKTFTVDPQSRFTIPTGSYPELRHQRFSAFLESTNNLPFVAERAVYWGDGLYAGHASVGTPWTATIATPHASDRDADDRDDHAEHGSGRGRYRRDDHRHELRRFADGPRHGDAACGSARSRHRSR